jgi:hypothetical protein
MTLPPLELLALDMPWPRRAFPLVLAVALAAVTIEMIRRRKLREEYAMIWLAASAVALVFGLFPALVVWLQDLLSVRYITIVVLAAFFFLSLIVMHYAVAISKHAEQVRQLTQRIALLQEQLRRSGDRPEDDERAAGGEGGAPG